MFDKNLFLIDTETAGSIGYPRPYDVSYLIGNPQTKEILCSRAYVVREIWEDEELMASAYYASKRDLYKRDIESGKRKVLPWAVICKIIREDMAKYNCSTIGAYNMNFDHRAMDNDAKYITRGKYRFAFPKETDFICVWRMACTSILRSKWFFKWADANNAFTACGNLSTSAETAYRGRAHRMGNPAENPALPHGIRNRAELRVLANPHQGIQGSAGGVTPAPCGRLYKYA